MAKMFYTMDETKAALGRSEDEIKQLAKDGKLREFRDGPRLMFKADQVETLKSEIVGGGTDDQVGLGAGDTHTPLGLMDSKSGSGSGAAMKADTATGTPGPRTILLLAWMSACRVRSAARSAAARWPVVGRQQRHRHRLPTAAPVSRASTSSAMRAAKSIRWPRPISPLPRTRSALKAWDRARASST